MSILDAQQSVLYQIIRTIYRRFARYERRLPLSSQYCYIPVEAFQRLQTIPLADLTTEDLNDYAFSPCYTEGIPFEIDHNYKHFLPRMLELVASSPGFPTMGIQTVFEKFTTEPIRRAPDKAVGWFNLLEDEKTVLDHYLTTLWSIILLSPRIVDTIDCLYSLSVVYEDLSPFLAIWVGYCDHSIWALVHLIKFIDYLYYEKRSHVVNGDLGGSPGARFSTASIVHILEWVGSPDIGTLLEALFYNYTNNPLEDTPAQRTLLKQVYWETDGLSLNDFWLTKISESLTQLKWIKPVEPK